MKLPLVGALLLALSLSFPALAGPPGAPPDEFIEKAEELAQWIADNSDFGPMPYHPAYIFVPNDQLHYIYFAGSGLTYTGVTDLILAAYSDGFMFLPDTFDMNSDVDMSMLLHELVHHLQFVESREYKCAPEMERVAYDIADEWREEHGLPPHLDPLSYLIYTSCNSPY